MKLQWPVLTLKILNLITWVCLFLTTNKEFQKIIRSIQTGFLRGPRIPKYENLHWSSSHSVVKRSVAQSQDKKKFILAKKIVDSEASTIYNPSNFLKSNIIMSGNSRPTVNEGGYIEKRSIVGSIEWFEKQIKISDVSGHCQSIKFKERKQLETYNPWETEVKPQKQVTIQMHGIEEIK